MFRELNYARFFALLLVLTISQTWVFAAQPVLPVRGVSFAPVIVVTTAETAQTAAAADNAADLAEAVTTVVFADQPTQIEAVSEVPAQVETQSAAISGELNLEPVETVTETAVVSETPLPAVSIQPETSTRQLADRPLIERPRMWTRDTVVERNSDRTWLMAQTRPSTEVQIRPAEPLIAQEVKPAQTTSSVEQDPEVLAAQQKLEEAKRLAAERIRLEQERQAKQAQTANPLVTETVIKNGGTHTIADLTIPHQPMDRQTKLNFARMVYGMTLIDQDKDKAAKFVAEYEAKVKPGPNAWDVAEDLVIKYAGQRVVTDVIGKYELKPEDVKIITTPEEIRKYAGLDPEKDFARMDWQLDPVGPCVIKKRADLLADGNTERIESQIRQVYDKNPDQADATIKSLRACAAQKEDSKTCFDKPMSLINFLLRNYGRKVVAEGKPESYLKGTNQSNAMGTIYWVPGYGWKGNGWQCCGNFLEFFELSKFPTDVYIPGIPTPSRLSCTIEPEKVHFTSRTDKADLRLSTQPPVTVDQGAVIDWYIGNERRGANSFEFQVSGTDVENNSSKYVTARVTMGTRQAECRSLIDLSEPLPPKPPTRPCPTCDKFTGPNVIRSTGEDAEYEVTLKPNTESVESEEVHLVGHGIDKIVATSRHFTLNASNVPVDAQGNPVYGGYEMRYIGHTTRDGIECPIVCVRKATIVFQAPPPPTETKIHKGGRGKKFAIALGIIGVAAGVIVWKTSKTTQVPVTGIKNNPGVILP